MSSFNSLMEGFASALTLNNLLFGLIGTILGTLVGVLPGIGPALAIALLLPITYSVSPASALIMFAAIYYGAMYGGSTTSILLNTPGESGSVITALALHLQLQLLVHSLRAQLQLRSWHLPPLHLPNGPLKLRRQISLR